MENSEPVTVVVEFTVLCKQLNVPCFLQETGAFSSLPPFPNHDSGPV
jgi:hypothetical protein